MRLGIDARLTKLNGNAPAITEAELLRVIRHELAVWLTLLEDFEEGRLTFDSLDRARVAAGRLRKALDLCSA